MILLVDTGTWLKLELLMQRQIFDPIRLYEWTTVHITHEVEAELDHFRCESWRKNLTHIVPIGNQHIFDDAIAASFDPADASILSNGRTDDPECFIVSEDRPLLEYARVLRLNAGLLADFFKICTAQDWLTNRELYQLVKILLGLKNIPKTTYKNILRWRERRQ